MMINLSKLQDATSDLINYYIQLEDNKGPGVGLESAVANDEAKRVIGGFLDDVLGEGWRNKL